MKGVGTADPKGLCACLQSLRQLVDADSETMTTLSARPAPKFIYFMSDTSYFWKAPPAQSSE